MLGIQLQSYFADIDADYEEALALIEDAATTTTTEATQDATTATTMAPTSPETGDAQHHGAWAIVVLISFGGLLGTVLYSRKKADRQAD